MHNAAKLRMIKIEMDDIVKKLKKEANIACAYHGWPETLARQHYNKAVSLMSFLFFLFFLFSNPTIKNFLFRSEKSTEI